MDEEHEARSGTRIFRAPPAVGTLGVISRSTTDATVAVSVNPEGAATTWRVEYAPVPDGFAGEVLDGVPVRVTVDAVSA